MSNSGTDDDFWNVGHNEGPRPARRRARTKRSSNTAQPQTSAPASESIFLPILPQREDLGLANDVSSSFTHKDLDSNHPTDSNGNDVRENFEKKLDDDARSDGDDDNIYGSTFESDDHSSNADDEYGNSAREKKKQAESYTIGTDKTSTNSPSLCASENIEDENSSFAVTKETHARNKSSEEPEAQSGKNFSLRVNYYADNLRSVDTAGPSTAVGYDVLDEGNVRQRTSDVFDEEGNLRKRKGKLIKWQSRSSTDVRMESTAAGVDERDALSCLSANDDVGYPPKARLKNALYRGRRQLALRLGDEAVEEFIRSFALARIVHGDDHWRTCRCRVFLSQAYLYLKEFFPQAENEAKTAKEILLRNLGTPLAPRKKLQVRHLLAVSSLVEGEARLMQGSLEGAAASLSRAHKHAVVFEKKMQKSERLLPASLLNMKPGDLVLHVLRVQAAVLAKSGRIPQAKVNTLLTQWNAFI
ncbi:hypothetical protein FHG87_022830 [Trinorchestia longiramus]|nr:hypothetical protein FHG87_022830 [Trinorchestia longiramus]